MILEPHVNQVAVNALDGKRLKAWYIDVFGFLYSGKMLYTPPLTTRVQGIQGATEWCDWLVDQQHYFQFEIFQFIKPQSKLPREDWRVSDLGYNLLGIWVRDFECFIERYMLNSTHDMPPIYGIVGDRRTCVKDPEGNLIEVREKDPLSLISREGNNIQRPDIDGVVRFMRVSVPSLDDAKDSFCKALGLTLQEGVVLHSKEDEVMWGLEGAECESEVLAANHFLLEIVKYQTPAPRPKPDGYQISDKGYMNFCLGYTNKQAFDSAFKLATTHGMLPNGEVVDSVNIRVIYVNDKHGYSVEMLYARKFFWGLSGFKIKEPYVEYEEIIDSPIDEAWPMVSDSLKLGGWLIPKREGLKKGRKIKNDLGCVRKASLLGSRVNVEVTELNEPYYYTYQIRNSFLFNHYKGHVALSRTEEGKTKVRRTARFKPKAPFTKFVLSWLLKRLFKHSLKNLARKS